MAFDLWVQLLQEIACLFSARTTQAVFVKEEIDAQIFLLHLFPVYNREMSNTR